MASRRDPETGPAGFTLRPFVRALGVDLRAGETRLAILLFLGFFFSLTFQYVAKTVRQASFLDAFGAERLPWVYLLVPVVSFPALKVYEALLARYRPAQVLGLTATGSAASLVAFWWLFGLSEPWVPFAFYLWITVAIGLNLSLVWSVAGVVLDPRQAKRLFGFLGAGAILGGIAGGQVARLVSAAAGVRATLLAAAALLALAAASAFLADGGGETEDGERKASGKERVAAGLREVWDSRFLRRVSAVLMLSMIAAQVVDLQFNWVVERATSGLADRTAFFGNFYSVMGVAAAVFQILWTSRIHRSLGVGFALRVLPTSLLAGTAALVLAASFWPAALLFAGLALKVGENGLRYSLDQSTRELLFVPVAEDLRVRAKAVIDVLLQRGGKGLAALLLLPVALGWASPVQAGWLNLGILSIWLLLLPGLYREYVRAFHGRLDSRREQEATPIDFSDAATLEILVESLGSADPRQVLHSLDLLASHGKGRLVPPLLLYHDDPEVRRRTLSILASARRADALPLIEKRLSDEHVEVQAAAIRVLAHLRHEAVGELMRPRLADPDPAIRAAAIVCLAGEDGEVPEAAKRSLADMLLDAEPKVRIEAARCLGALAEPTFQSELMRLLYDRDWRVVAEAIGAVRRRIVRDGWTPIYIPTLISLLRNRRLKHTVREALVAFGEPVLPSLLHFLNDTDEHMWVRRALPKTIALLGTRDGPVSLLENLGHQQDPFLRRKTVEALVTAREDVTGPGHATQVSVQIHEELGRYCRRLEEVEALSGGGEPTALLGQLLHERACEHLDNVFGLLSLSMPPEHVAAVRRGLASKRAVERGSALEFLDNCLDAGMRRTVMGVLDQPTEADALVHGRELLGVARTTRPDVLERCLEPAAEQDADWTFLAVAALFAVGRSGDTAMLERVRELTSAEDAFVGETATWVAGQLQSSFREVR